MIDFLKKLFSTTPSVDEDGCIACGSTDLEVIAPGAYRCLICGYEGGPGFAALQAKQQRDRLAQLEPAVLRQRLTAALDTARLSSLAILEDPGPLPELPSAVERHHPDPERRRWAQRQAAARQQEHEDIQDILAQRESAMLRATGDLHALTPLLEALELQGTDVIPHLTRLRALTSAPSLDQEQVRVFIQDAWIQFGPD
ncbi:MAG: hypothetical protein EA397_00505 [Deltaproteobacteria bacterium]|nr:MAG: hypothetical protein EA397_00505 [Deltaproteobacteria bacterium]